MQLYEEKAKLIVRAPTEEPAYVTELKERVSTLESSHKELQASHNQLQKCVQQLALRYLLHKSRAIFAGGPLSVEDRKTWNSRIAAGQLTIPEGVGSGAVKLTRFEEGTEQNVGNAAAHDFEVSAVAEAVVSVPSQKKAAHYRQLFKMCYGKTPDDVLISDMSTSDEEDN